MPINVCAVYVDTVKLGPKWITKMFKNNKKKKKKENKVRYEYVFT